MKRILGFTLAAIAANGRKIDNGDGASSSTSGSAGGYSSGSGW